MLKMIFWDVQHGSATYIQTPNGKHIAIDLGQGSYNESDRVFSPLKSLRRNGVNRLDSLVITHPHRDHLDDIVNIEQVWPKAILRPIHLNRNDILSGNRREDQTVINKYLELSDGSTGTIEATDNCFLPQNNGGVTINAYIPTSCPTTNLNNHSVVMVIGYAGSKIIIPGDNEPSSWDELLKQKGFVQDIRGTDILVAPHHGRESGFSAALFEHISPRLVIISDGRFCDTSATDRYSKKASGWKVHKRSGGMVDRKCVTTRNDGFITVDFGTNPDANNFMQVKIK